MNAKLCKDMLKKISAFHKKIKNQQIVWVLFYLRAHLDCSSAKGMKW